MRQHTFKSFLTLFAGTFLCSCSVSDSDSEATSQTAASLAQKYQDDFIIGATADQQSYRTHAAILKHHFNGFTTENEMKFESLQPTKGNYQFTTADNMVSFARENDMTVRGHALVWHRQTPEWVFTGPDGTPRSEDDVLEIMTTHIGTVVNHFKDRVAVWDVVNEAITDQGTLRSDNEPGSDQSSLWYARTGTRYIEEAFRAAHKADPSAKLFYNDYYNYLPKRREAIYELVKGLIERGIPIHGIGLQTHINTRPSVVPTHQSYHQTIDNIERAIQRYASLGLEVQITELDMSVYVGGQKYTPDEFFTDESLPNAVLAEQAERYKALFAMLRRNSDVISSVTFWGIADDNTWLSEFDSGRSDFPLLFNKKHQPKPAFYAIMDF